MKLPRFSISATMAIIVILAIDLGLVRYVTAGPWKAGAQISVLACLGVFFMVNILAYQSISVLSRHRPLGPFRKGFFWGGAISAIGFVAWLWMDPDSAIDAGRAWTKQSAHFYVSIWIPYRQVNWIPCRQQEV
jgi:hypothetical protein